ncbi:MAG: GNAT family N-acetyltransferase [Pseudomonadota bacterium]
MNLQSERSIPKAAEYCELRVAAGLSPRSRAAAEAGLPNTLCGVCVRDDGRLIGMGRLIGDGGCNYEVVDIAVHPDYQRRGLGTEIMQSLMGYLEENAPPSAYVSMIADEGAPALYARFGFEPVAPVSIGMARRF